MNQTGGELGIRTPDSLWGEYSLSRRAPSASRSALRNSQMMIAHFRQTAQAGGKLSANRLAQQGGSFALPSAQSPTFSSQKSKRFDKSAGRRIKRCTVNSVLTRKSTTFEKTADRTDAATDTTDATSAYAKNASSTTMSSRCVRMASQENKDTSSSALRGAASGVIPAACAKNPNNRSGAWKRSRKASMPQS